MHRQRHQFATPRSSDQLRRSRAAVFGFALTGVVLVEVVILGTLAATARPAHAQAAGEDAEAMIRRGTELRHRDQDAQALPYFESAYKLSRNPRTAAQLGLVKMALGYCVDAERLLDEALLAPDHPWIQKNLSALQQTRDKARQSVGEVVIASGPAGAAVLVNGQPAGQLPLAAPLRFDRGSVEIEIRMPGYLPLRRTLTIKAGARECLDVALVRAKPRVDEKPVEAAPLVPAMTTPPPVLAPPREAPAPAAAAAESASSESSNSDPRRTGPAWLRPAAWVAAGGAVAGLTLGIVETIVATNRIAEFNNHTGLSPTAADPNRTAPDCETAHLSETCRSIRDAHDRARTLAIVGYAGAAAFAAASATAFILSTRTSPTAHASAGPPALLCAPTLAAAGASLGCRLTF